MRNLIIWIKRHYIQFGAFLVLASSVLFGAIYKVNQSKPPGELTVNQSGIFISMQAAPIGVWIIFAIALGSGGVILIGYDLLRKRDMKDTLDKQFEKMLKRK